VVLAGRVLSIEQGPRQQVRARVTVETVLQGELGGTLVDVYCGRKIERQGRYAFLLTRAQGVLCAASAIPMASGLHRTAPLPGRPAGERIATMLLTPGDGMDVARFARELTGSVTFAIEHLGRWRTAKLLKQLAADERAPIGQGACAQLTAWFWGQDACWDRLDKSASTATVAESRATEREQRARTADPDRWWKQMSAGSPPGQLLDELRLLTIHKDPRIRARYCRFLRAHYPDERDCGCEAAGPAAIGQTSI
jgi:hypothetical protein